MLHTHYFISLLTAHTSFVAFSDMNLLHTLLTPLSAALSDGSMFFA